MKRVSLLAEAQKHWLGNQLSEKLCSFERQWQLAIKVLLGSQATFQIAGQQALEHALLFVVHAIAQKFPGDLFMCMSFFNFSLLYEGD